MEQAMARLSPARRVTFRYILGQAQKYIALREFMKSVLVRELAQTKKEINVISRRFARDGFIGGPGDFYFLTMDEVEVIARGQGSGIPVDELVERRRREYERNQTVVLPEYSKGRPRPLSLEELESRGGVEVLDGIPVSPGKVTGRARVITDPRRHAEIKPGEILVAPVTDAAWTPLFVTAGAIVVDVGGPLSHGSIVAREFGIPGVLSVGMATRLIKTGQVVTVDGDCGKVYLHPSRTVTFPGGRVLTNSRQACWSAGPRAIKRMKGTGAPLEAGAEYSHDPSDDFHWNESFYFNFTDPGRRWAVGQGSAFFPTRKATSGAMMLYAGGSRILAALQDGAGPNRSGRVIIGRPRIPGARTP